MRLGVHRGVPAREYHTWPGLGSTSLALAAQWSVAHAQVPTETSPAMRTGSLIHAAVLEPERLGRDILEAPPLVDCEGRGKPCSRTAIPGARHCWQHGGREEAEEYRATLPEGAEVIAKEEYEDVYAAAYGIREGVQRSSLGRLLTGGDREVSIVAAVESVDPLQLRVEGEAADSDLIVRGRIDLWHPGVCVDLKTTSTRCPSPRQWGWRMADRGGLVQAALYTALAAAVAGQPHVWLWLVAEQQAPHAVRIYEPLGEDMERAGDDLARGLERWAAYIATGDRWHGWPTATATVSVPHREEGEW